MNEKTEAEEVPKAEGTEPEVEETHEHPPEKQASGGSGAFLATLLALLILGGAFFYLWQQQSAVKADMRALEGSIDKLLEVIEQRHQEQLTTIPPHQHSAMDEGIRQNATQLRQLQNQVGELRKQVGQDHLGWMVAEVDYLLRIADHRLSLEHDRQTAIAALRTASNRMELQDKNVFADVIQKIQEDINAIDAFDVPDRNLLASEIAELINKLEQLPLSTRASPSSRVPEPVVDTAASDSWDSFWQKIRRDLRGLVTIRREGEAQRPVLAPEPRYFLRQNLQLKLESARLALLTGNTQAWRTTLDEAGEWLSRYFDVDNEQVSNALNALERLAAVELSPALPQLDETRALLQKIAEQKEAAESADTAAEPVQDEKPSGPTEKAVDNRPQGTDSTAEPIAEETKAEGEEPPPQETPPPTEPSQSMPADDMPSLPKGDQP